MACNRLSSLLLSVMSLVCACRDEAQGPESREAPPPGPSLSGPLNLPAERYVMTRYGERCTIEILRNGEVDETLPTDYACPKELELGERIRLTGMTCMRESADGSELSLPVVCPNPLTNAERDLRSPPDGAH